MTDETNRTGIALLGCGRWGPNHLRVFNQMPDAEVLHVVDLNSAALEPLARVHRHIAFGADINAALSDDRVEAVIIATPAETHAGLIRRALDGGKHVLVEKPVCTESDDARELHALASERQRVLMVGHVFLFNDVFRRVETELADGTIGRLQYIHTLRTNLGPIRRDVNAVYDLASHDISTTLRLFGTMPATVSAQGCSPLHTGREDVASLTLHFSDGRAAFIHVSWLDPCKVRRMTVVGDRKMIVWDDVNTIEPLRIYDKGVDEPAAYGSFGEFHLRLRESDVVAPRVSQREPLANQAAAFLAAVRDGAANLSTADFGADVLSVVEAATASLQVDGRKMPVHGERAITIQTRPAAAISRPSIPLVDLRWQHDQIRDEIHDALDGLLDSGQFILGDAVERFEREFADYCGAAHCIGVGNGLDALRLSLQAHGIGLGDEVITVANTFIATALAITGVGATPVFVDHDPHTYVIDVKQIARAITPRTRAILSVHLYGHPAPMDPIMALAAQYGLRVIEDAAQAHGAEYFGRRCGSLGHAAAFSFYPGKNLGGCGDGGAIVTNDDLLAERLRALRNYGSRTKYLHELPGTNSRLDTMQAAILSLKLKRLDAWNAHRRDIAAQYTEMLAGAGCEMPKTSNGATHAFHLFVVRTPHRDEQLQRLQTRGINAGIHYPIPIHRQAAMHGVPHRLATALTNTEQFASQLLSLPIYPGMTREQVQYVVDAFRSAEARRERTLIVFPQRPSAVA